MRNRFVRLMIVFFIIVSVAEGAYHNRHPTLLNSPPSYRLRFSDMRHDLHCFKECVKREKSKRKKGARNSTKCHKACIAAECTKPESDPRCSQGRHANFMSTKFGYGFNFSLSLNLFFYQ